MCSTGLNENLWDREHRAGTRLHGDVVLEMPNQSKCDDTTQADTWLAGATHCSVNPGAAISRHSDNSDRIWKIFWVDQLGSFGTRDVWHSRGS